MAQSKVRSFVEALTNTGIGLMVAGFFQTLFVYMLGIQMTTTQNLALVGLMTLVSIARSYIIRRIFNKGDDSDEN